MKFGILKSIIIIIFTASMLVMATMAWFSNSAFINNRFSAGTVTITAEETVVPPPHIMSNWNPGDCTEKEFTVINTGSKSVYLRGIITGRWYNPDDTPFYPDPDLDVVSWDFCDESMSELWFRQGDTWYYKNPLPGTYSGATQEERQAVLCIMVCLSGPLTDNQYQGKTFKLTAEFQAVQSSNEAVDQAWPDNPYSGYQGNQLFDMALFAYESVVLGSSAQIQGNVGTNSATVGAINMTWNTKINGNVLIGKDGIKEEVITIPAHQAYETFIDGDITALETPRSYQMPAFPDNLPDGGELVNNWQQQHHIDSDYSFTGIEITNNSTLTIDTGDGDRIIRTGSLTMSGHIVLEGTGRLLLYIDDFIDAGSGSSFNSSGSAGNLIVFVGGSSVKLGNSNVFRGGLMAPSAHVESNGSHKIVGAVIANRYTAGSGERLAITYQNINY